MTLIGQCGDSPEARVKTSGFPKAETLLMSTVARYKKLQYPVWKNESGEAVLEVSQSQKDLQEALALDADKLVRECRDFVVANAEKQLVAAVAALSPLAKGLPEGKSWKEGVEVGLQLAAAAAASSSCSWPLLPFWRPSQHGIVSIY